MFLSFNSNIYSEVIQFLLSNMPWWLTVRCKIIVEKYFTLLKEILQFFSSLSLLWKGGKQDSQQLYFDIKNNLQFFLSLISWRLNFNQCPLNFFYFHPHILGMNPLVRWRVSGQLYGWKSLLAGLASCCMFGHWWHHLFLQIAILINWDSGMQVPLWSLLIQNQQYFQLL